MPAYCSESLKEKIITDFQNRLVLLHHSSTCSHSNSASFSLCRVSPYCKQTCDLLKHAKTCHETDCSVGHCQSTRYLLQHSSNCRESSCQVCKPLKEVLARKKTRSKTTVVVVVPLSRRKRTRSRADLQQQDSEEEQEEKDQRQYDSLRGQRSSLLLLSCNEQQQQQQQDSWDSDTISTKSNNDNDQAPGSALPLQRSSSSSSSSSSSCSEGDYNYEDLLLDNNNEGGGDYCLTEEEILFTKSILLPSIAPVAPTSSSGCNNGGCGYDCAQCQVKIVKGYRYHCAICVKDFCPDCYHRGDSQDEEGEPVPHEHPVRAFKVVVAATAAAADKLTK